MTSWRDNVPTFLAGMVRTCRSVLAGLGVVFGLGLGGISVEVVWAQTTPGDQAGAEQPQQLSQASIPDSSKASEEPSPVTAVIEAERTETATPPSAHPGGVPERERVVLEGDHWPAEGWPSGLTSDLLLGHLVSTTAPDWSRTESGLTESEGVLVVRSRRFSSPREACQDLTQLAVGWLRQKYEQETRVEIRHPVAILREYLDKTLVLQSYVQEIPLNDQKVIETPMYIAHLRLPVTPELREAVYSSWRAQMVNLSLFQLVGAAAIMSFVCFVVGRSLHNLHPEP